MSRQSRSERAAMIALVSVIALAILLGSAPAASALGVTPGRKTVDFSPGLEQSASFTITNTDHKAFDAYVYVEGALKDYVTIEQDIVGFKESDNSKTVTYRVSLPERLDPPGDHWAKIVVMELPAVGEPEEGETRILATVAVIHQLRVKVPYPGKYMQLDMSVQAAVPSEPVNFFVKLYNLGDDDIAKARATIQVLGPTNEVIATLDTDSKPVKSMARGELMAVWDADVNPGMYHAVATVRYDGEAGTVEKSFYVGNMLVDVLDVSVKDFRLGGIAKFDILAESRWNQQIKDVYAHMVVRDLQDNKVADFKSASVDLEPFERTHLNPYWDTEGVQEGDYVTKLSLHYAGRTTERDINTRVGLESIRTEIVGISVGAVTGEGGAFDQYTVVLLIAVLVAINLGWFLYFRRRSQAG